MGDELELGVDCSRLEMCHFRSGKATLTAVLPSMQGDVGEQAHVVNELVGSPGVSVLINDSHSGVQEFQWLYWNTCT